MIKSCIESMKFKALEVVIGCEYELNQSDEIKLLNCSILFPEYSSQIQLVVNGQIMPAATELLRITHNKEFFKFLESLEKLTLPHQASEAEHEQLLEATEVNQWQAYTKAGYSALSEAIIADNKFHPIPGLNVVASQFAIADSEDLVTSDWELHKKRLVVSEKKSQPKAENLATGSNGVFKLVFGIIFTIVSVYFLASWYPILGFFVAFFIVPLIFKK